MPLPVNQPIPSPCVSLCELGADGYCIGCFRTGDEIARWIAMGDAERLRLMREVLPAREAAHAGPHASAHARPREDDSS